MAHTVYLHVGLPKSGTTYLQRLLAANQEALRAEQNLLVPSAEWSQQVAAVRQIRGMRRRRRKAARGAWRRLVQEVNGWDGAAVWSMEWLCAASTDQIEEIVDAFAPGRVEVVFTARDLGRALPSSFQEGLQNRRTWEFEEFLLGVSAEDPLSNGPGRRFWAKHDLPHLAGRWAEALTPEQVHVVTVPGTGAPPDLLWKRFSEVLGVDPGGYADNVVSRNASLGRESTELMRRVNLAARAAGLSKEGYDADVKHGLSKRVLAGRRSQESSLVVPARYHAWIAETARRHVREVGELGVAVVGDLADLEPRLKPAPDAPTAVGEQLASAASTDPASEEARAGAPAEAEVLEAAVGALVALLQERGRSRGAIADLTRDNERLTAHLTRSRARAARLAQRVRAFEAAPVRVGTTMGARRLRHRVGHRVAASLPRRAETHDGASG